MKNTTLTVIDFFSGAGGFSEGFRQQGFKVVKGVDYWEPAVRTHNLNHGLSDTPENVLDYVGSNSSDVELINALPDADVIIGSPSCVTFSMSNKGGKADKTEGLRLIEAYLRVIAVKKHAKNSHLKAWLMENVPNSGNYVKHDYKFIDLNLKDWAKSNNIDPESIALTLNGVVLNASDYGAPQNRSRFICGESVSDGKFPLPQAFKQAKPLLKEVRSKMPQPNNFEAEAVWQDPNYPSLKLEASRISDHFYDTGLYITQWEQARYLKTMHPFMGKMSFPEDENKSSRTITATKSASTRESIVYKSEYQREGHGEYRAPTIREAASLMGYPYTYQFFGSEALKWKLIGNSVSPQLSAALAKEILSKEGMNPVPLPKIQFTKQKDLHLSVNNLNTFSPAKFEDLKKRRPGARFRRSISKGQNTTVDLMNYKPGQNQDFGQKWYIGIFYGTGMDHKFDVINAVARRRIIDALESNFTLFEEFKTDLAGLPAEVSSRQLQSSYENDSSLTESSNPIVICEAIQRITSKYSKLYPELSIDVTGLNKKSYNLLHLLSLASLIYIVYNNFQTEPAQVGENSLIFEA